MKKKYIFSLFFLFMGVFCLQAMEEKPKVTRSLSEFLRENKQVEIKDGVLDLSAKNINSLSGIHLIIKPNVSLIESINLDNNALNTLGDSFMWVLRLGKLKHFSVRNNNLVNITPIDFGRLPFLERILFSGNKLSSVPMIKSPTLTLLGLDNNKIETIRSGVFFGIGNLRRLSLRGNNLTSISRNSFAGLGKLEELDISSNEISSIAPEAFRMMVQLKEVLLQGNQLTKNQIVLLSASLPGVEIVSDYGRIINGQTGKDYVRISAGQQSATESDEYVDLSSFESATGSTVEPQFDLKKLDESSIKGSVYQLIRGGKIPLSQQGELFFSQAGIRSIRGIGLISLFEKAHLVNDIDFSYNNLSVIEAEDFLTFKMLESLNLSHNKISLPGQYPLDFSPLKNLRSLFLASNSFTRVPKVISSSLVELDLRYNYINALGGSEFTKLPLLLKLYLNRNKISFIDVKAFYKLEKLQNLDLSSNSLNVIQPGVFDPLVSLTFLKLSSNKISNIPANCFIKNRDLTYLDLDNNLLTNLSPETCAQLEALEVLSLRKNKISQLSLEAVGFLKNIKKIDLRGNPIQKEEINKLVEAFPAVGFIFDK